MQVVIDIDEDTYKDIKKGEVYSSIRDVPQESVLAIANGTPLPKGHGRLIDADRLTKAKRMWYRLKNGDVACPEIDIENAPTIIEADRSEEDGQKI
jgi:hypothetical protein